MALCVIELSCCFSLISYFSRFLYRAESLFCSDSAYIFIILELEAIFRRLMCSKAVIAPLSNSCKQDSRVLWWTTLIGCRLLYYSYVCSIVESTTVITSIWAVTYRGMYPGNMVIGSWLRNVKKKTWGMWSFEGPLYILQISTTPKQLKYRWVSFRVSSWEYERKVTSCNRDLQELCDFE